MTPTVGNGTFQNGGQNGIAVFTKILWALSSLSMGTHGLRFLHDFFANLRFLGRLRFSD